GVLHWVSRQWTMGTPLREFPRIAANSSDQDSIRVNLRNSRRTSGHNLHLFRFTWTPLRELRESPQILRAGIQYALIREIRVEHPTTTCIYSGSLRLDRKSTRLNSSHVEISYAV